ncbi:zinc finger protein 83-like [Anopheles nili]|uniref:zinc finger protein 83-like n=1 Tax=Anopheles nili TaxID=185578 RepID=UPI00237BAFDA|nr:zinc finger protein 83-like [Anopheles nili]
MTENTCALCLSTNSSWFVDVLNEDRKTLDIAEIIKKHIWFEFKPKEQACICGECWTSLHDFHIFYTKIETIHNHEFNDTSCSKRNLTAIKIEILNEDVDPERSTNFESQRRANIKRPTRASNIPLKYQTFYTNLNEKKYFVDVDEFINENNSSKRAMLTRKIEYLSGSEPEDVDYDARLELQKRLNLDDFAFYEYERNLELRDERLFKYVDEFSCSYCIEKVTFQRFVEANHHYKIIHNEPGFLKCPKCDKKCFTPGMFISHMETHEDPEKNKCDICGKMTDCNISLKKHMRVHQAKLEENLPFPCSRCKRRFESEEQLQRHEKLHIPKPYVKKEMGPDLELLEFYKRIYCDICEEVKPESTSFENFWDLRVHMGNEHNKAVYLKCPICSARNAYRQHLITHIDMHKNPEKYRCEVCKEIFQNLDQHMIKAHTANTVPAEKKHKCDQCGRMFNFLANLKMHIDCIHGLKDIRCNICNKYFNLKAYRAHKRSAHTDQMYMCEQCPKMFSNRRGLEAHKGYHDESLLKLIKCTLCDKKIRICSMSKHMKTIHSEEEPVNCNMCGKTFRTMFHMKRHRKNTCAATIDSRKFKCSECGKGFSTKLTMMEHMTIHTRSNQYQCAFCFKSFGYISNLYKHRKKAHPLEWQEVQARPEEGIATVIVVRN